MGVVVYKSHVCGSGGRIDAGLHCLEVTEMAIISLTSVRVAKHTLLILASRRCENMDDAAGVRQSNRDEKDEMGIGEYEPSRASDQLLVSATNHVQFIFIPHKTHHIPPCPATAGAHRIWMFGYQAPNHEGGLG